MRLGPIVRRYGSRAEHGSRTSGGEWSTFTRRYTHNADRTHADSRRLDSIDAPELGQAFGKRSKQSLAEICGGKTAQAAERGRDR